jgi:putative membrane protein
MTIDDSTRLAADRTRVAYERTMLAWIRTATTLITFGFSISRFFDYLRPNADTTRYLIGPQQFGLILVCLGLGSLALAAFEYRQGIRELAAVYAGKRHSVAVIVAVLVAVLGVFALLATIFAP